MCVAVRLKFLLSIVDICLPMQLKGDLSPSDDALPPLPTRVPDMVVFTDGDGHFPKNPVADFQPHGVSNIVSLAVLPHDSRIVLSGSADRRLHATLLREKRAAPSGREGIPTHSFLPLDATALSGCSIPAPALSLTFSPTHLAVRCGEGFSTESVRTFGVLSAGLMDGSIAIILWSYSRNDADASVSFSMQISSLLKTHSKYASRTLFSADGSLLASASHDGSVCIFRVDLRDSGARGEATVSLLQRIFWGPPNSLAGEAAAVEAIAWAPLRTRQGQGLSSSLVVSVRGAPTLQYVSVLNLSIPNPDVSSAMLLHGLEPATALPLPTLPLTSSSSLADAATASEPLPLLVLHRVPLSEDGGLSSIFASSSSTAVIDPVDVTVTSMSEEGPAKGVRITPGAAAQHQRASASAFADFYPSVAHPSAPDERDARTRSEREPSVLEDRSEGGRFIPVGFTIIDLALSPQSSNSDDPLLAAAADNGVIFVLRFGSNAVLRRLVGHYVTSEFTAGTRIAWWPALRGSPECTPEPANVGGVGAHYLVASSERDFAAVIYSVGSQQVVARLGLGQPRAAGLGAGASKAEDNTAERESRLSSPLSSVTSAGDVDVADGSKYADAPPLLLHSHGHTASIKAVVCAPQGGGRPPLLFTAGFDKRVIAWAE